MDRLKVANFSDTYLPQNNGVATALSDMHNSKKKWDDEVFAPVKNKEVNKIGYILLPATPEYKFAFSTEQIIKKTKDFDIIHAHTPYPMFHYAKKCARANAIPFIGSFHTDPSAFFGHVLSTDSKAGQKSSAAMWKYLINIYNKCDAVIVPSKNTGEEVKRRGLSKEIIVVPNGVDTKKFSPKVDTSEFYDWYGIPKTKKIVLFLGRLEKRKRPDTFVRAAMESDSNAFFIVAGRGKMKSKLMDIAKENDNIFFADFIEEKLLAQAFSAADVFVFSSEMETQGIVLLEAMASGCAVLSTPVGSAPDLLRTDHLFKLADHKTLAKKIDSLLADEQKLKKIKTDNQKIVEANYTLEKTLKLLKDAYDKILKRFSEKKITVVIPTLNEINTIGDCLEAIKDQTYKNFEIIVADSYSKDGTIELAKKYGKVIFCGKKGPGPARNAAVKVAKGEIIAFTDADTIVPKDWLKRIAYNFTLDSKLGGVGGMLVPLEGNLIDESLFKLNSDLFYRASARLGFYQLPTPNCAYTKEAFNSVGGFDEALSMFEDTDLSIRASRLKKLKIDSRLYVLNSIRRTKQEKYSMMLFKYIKVYLDYFMGRGVTEKHFEIIEH